MDWNIVETVVFAPFAPLLGVLLFWFIQLLFVESLKHHLRKIWDRHQPFCRFTNFMGVLFQAISHAIGYTITRSGVAEFYISVEGSRVSPKKEKKGMPAWAARLFLVLGPFFIPPLLVFLLFLVGHPNWSALTSTFQGFSFSNMLITFGANLASFGREFIQFVAQLDLLNPFHLCFLLLLILVGFGIRPSYLEGKKKKRVRMMDDLLIIKELIYHHPYYMLLGILLCYVFFITSYFLNQGWYALLFSILGWLSIIAIVAIIAAHLPVLLIRATDDLDSPWRVLPYLLIFVSYGMARLFFVYYPSRYQHPLSLSIMILSTAVAAFLLRQRQKGQGVKLNTMKSIKDLTDYYEEGNS